MSSDDKNDKEPMTNGNHGDGNLTKQMDLNEMDENDLGLLEKDIDNLNSALDQMENWSNSLHDKVAELLKETREQNQQTNCNTKQQDKHGDNKEEEKPSKS